MDTTTETLNLWRRPSRGDLLLAAALTVAMALAAALTGPSGLASRAGSVVVSLGLLALVHRRRRPFSALTMVLVVVLVEVIAAPNGTEAPAFLALMVGTYTLAAYSGLRSLVPGIALAIAGVSSAQYLAPEEPPYSHAEAITFFIALLVVAPAVIGAVVGAQRQLAGHLRATTEALAGSRDAHVQATLARERDRVAAEIDRVVLRDLAELRAPMRARTLDEVKTVEQSARDLLAAMRRLLGELRELGDESPQPAQSVPEPRPPAREAPEPRPPAQTIPELRTRLDAALAAGHSPSAARHGPSAAGRPLPGAGNGTLRPALWARWVVIRSAAADRLLAAGSVAFAIALAVTRLTSVTPWPNRLGAAALAAALPLPLIWVRRRPLAAALGCALTAVVFGLVAAPSDVLAGLPPVPILILAPLLAGVAAPAARSLFALAVCLGGVIGMAAADIGAPFDLGSVVASATWTVGCWAAGQAIRGALAALAVSAQAALGQEQRRRAQTRAALDVERARLARDLHDAVGHAMTVLVLQASAARRVWDSDPRLASEHVGVLRDTVAQVLDELRPMVLSLALENISESVGLSALPALIERARSCGLLVTLNVEPGTAEPAPDLDTAIYLIVQESLTNAARYAPGAAVRVGIEKNGEAVRVEVINDAPTEAHAAVTGSGQGLRGMAERVASLGGHLDVNASPHGGFAVVAVLPRRKEATA